MYLSSVFQAGLVPDVMLNQWIVDWRRLMGEQGRAWQSVSEYALVIIDSLDRTEPELSEKGDLYPAINQALRPIYQLLAGFDKGISIASLGEPGRRVCVDWFKPGGKWYAGEVVNIGNAAPHDSTAVARAIYENQGQLVKDSLLSSFDTIIRDTPGNAQDSDYHDFYGRRMTANDMVKHIANRPAARESDTAPAP